jgi:hypothetical protein
MSPSRVHRIFAFSSRAFISYHRKKSAAIALYQLLATGDSGAEQRGDIC